MKWRIPWLTFNAGFVLGAAAALGMWIVPMLHTVRMTLLVIGLVIVALKIFLAGWFLGGWLIIPHM